MKKHLATIYFILILSHTYAQKTYKYPVAPKDSIVDIYFDTLISDPYQWMENAEDPRLEEWLDEQKKITKKESNSHTRISSLRAQIASLYINIGAEKKEGYMERDLKFKNEYEFHYTSRNSNRSPDLQYRTSKKEIFRTLVKAKNYQINKHDNVWITNRIVNETEDLMAVELSHNGGDWYEVFFFDLATGEQLSDTLKHIRPQSNIIWNKRDVYYDRFNKPEKGRELLDKATGQRLYYHKSGTKQSNDLMLYENPDTTGTNSFNYLKLGDKIFFYQKLKSKGEDFHVLSYFDIISESFQLNNFLIYPSSDSTVLKVEALFGDSVILQTNWNAPNGKVFLANIKEKNKLYELVPEYDVLLHNVNRLGKDKIACIYRNGGKNLVLIFNLKGELLKKIDFDQGIKVNYFYENNTNVEYTDFSISSFYHPDIWYQLSLKNLTFKYSKTILIPYKAETLETRYIKYPSKDGSEIPMYITCLKDTKLDGNNATLLYGYGGYGTTIEPSFDVSKALWLLHGGILAIPNIRGGGAEGTEWAKAGRRLNKQNAIDDFIAASEYLIREGYTNNEKIAINGGSHGGMLVGAAMTQRPELFKVAIAEAGAYDMLRVENFGSYQVYTNIQEFGQSSDSTDFYNLKSYSPIHNIKKGIKYPNVLLITGDSDDRVPPYHSYKFLATLQEKGNPQSFSHLYIVPESGHQGALTFKDAMNVLLYKYYFLFEQLGVRFY